MSIEILATPAAAKLAVRASFDPERLDRRDPTIQELIEWYSVQARGGRDTGLMLRESARIDALAAVLRRDAAGLSAVRRETEPHYEGPLQRALDAFVTEGDFALDEGSEDELAAALHVVRWAVGAYARAEREGGPGPSVREEIEGRLRILEVTRPITELLRDGFIGRREELKILRDFLNEGDHGLGLFEAPALVVHGIGGMGKSTLIARFVQDVLKDAASGNANIGAWAYLDFDRATLTPTRHGRRPRPMLVIDDLVRQVGAQRPELRAVLEASGYFEEQQSLAQGLESRGFHEDYDGSAFWLASTMRYALEDRPLAVILDTFEEVERTGPDAGEELFRLFDRFSSVIPNLRLVVSGRAPAAPFLNTPSATLEVGELGSDDARQVLSAFAHGAAARGSSELIDEHTANTVGDLVGRSPLTLRLAGRVLAADGVDAIADSARRARTLNRIRTEFVRGFLYHRILDHLIAEDDSIGDTLKAVARAGLALREINEAAIEKVLLPALGFHESTRDANALFAALEHEVALIEQEGGTLRLRQELRGPALAALELEDARLVRRVHDLAVPFYAGRNAAEVAYHRLARGEEVATLEHHLIDENLDALRKDLAGVPAGTAALLKSEAGGARGLHRATIRKPGSHPPASRKGGSTEPADALEAAREQMAWERQILSAADSALRAKAYDEAWRLLGQRQERGETSELHRLESRIAEAEGNREAAIEAARRDLKASTAAEHPVRIAAAGVHLAKLLEWADKGTEALAVLGVAEDSHVLAGEWALRLELVLSRLTTAERTGLEEPGDRWGWSLDARSHLARLGTEPRSDAQVRLLAAVLGRDEPVYIRDAVFRIGLDPDAPAHRVRALAEALHRWDQRLGDEAPPGAVARALRVEGPDGGTALEAWQMHLSGLGTRAAKVFGNNFWNLGVDDDVLDGLRQFYLHAEYDPPPQWRASAGEAGEATAPHFLDPLDFLDEKGRELESLLLKAYSNSSELERLAFKAGASTYIDLSASPDLLVRQLLQWARAHDRMRELISTVREDRGGFVSTRLLELVGEDWLSRKD